MYRLFFDYPLLLNNGRKEWLLRKLACSFWIMTWRITMCAT
jgi:hypothetical protein